MGLIDFNVFLRVIPTTALTLGGIGILYDGLNTNNAEKTLAGIFLTAIGVWLQYYYLKRRYDSQ